MVSRKLTRKDIYVHQQLQLSDKCRIQGCRNTGEGYIIRLKGRKNKVVLKDSRWIKRREDKFKWMK